jgi:hypothetical protein
METSFSCLAAPFPMLRLPVPNMVAWHQLDSDGYAPQASQDSRSRGYGARSIFWIWLWPSYSCDRENERVRFAHSVGSRAIKNRS